MKFVNRNRKFIKVSSVSVLRADAALTTAEALLSASAGFLQPGEQFQVLRELHKIPGTADGVYDLVICSGINVSLPAIKRVLKQYGILFWQSCGDVTEVMLADAGYEPVLVTPALVMARSDGKIVVDSLRGKSDGEIVVGGVQVVVDSLKGKSEIAVGGVQVVVDSLRGKSEIGVGGAQVVVDSLKGKSDGEIGVGGVHMVDSLKVKNDGEISVGGVQVVVDSSRGKSDGKVTVGETPGVTSQVIANNDGKIGVRQPSVLTSLVITKNVGKIAAGETSLKQQLIAIAAETISMPAQNFDVTTQFSDYGFDSILGTDLITRVNEVMGTTLKATDLYSYPNINLLAGYIQQHTTIMAAPVETSAPDNAGYIQQHTTLMAAPVEISASDSAGYIQQHTTLMTAPVETSASDNAGYIQQHTPVRPAPVEISASDNTGYNQQHTTLRAAPVEISAPDNAGYIQQHTPVMTAPVEISASDNAGYIQQHTPVMAAPAPDMNKDSGDIAIIGISGQFGSANNTDEFWEVLKNGQSLITPVPTGKWDSDVAAWGSCIENPDMFDPLFFKLSGSEAEMMDPRQRLFLEHCWKALEDAAIDPESLSGSKCAVYAGVGQGDYAARMEGTLPSALWGNSAAILSSRISYFLNLKGPAVSVDTACSSSLVAIDMGFTSLRRGDTDLVITGGVNIINSAHAYQMAERAGMLSPDGRCYTFDSRANGFVMGEGVGVIIMKRLADAVRDNDHIYGVIKGCLTNQDGTTNGITAPSVLSQQELERAVYNRFNINPETISYVEAHGTGTSLGDPIEFEALCASFRSFTPKQQFCALGSVKTNIGHTLEAAGVAGVIKILLAMKHQQLPPTINYKENNPLIKFEDSPFTIQRTLTPWVGAKRAAISSFGFSGTNVHLVIEAYAPAQKPATYNGSPAIIVLSAKNKEQLQEQVNNLATFVAQTPAYLHDIAYTLQTGRAAMDERVAIVASSKEALLSSLQAYPAGNIFRGNVRQQKINSQATIAEQWTQGAQIDWVALYNGILPAKISLPTYPFARERYWIKSAGNNSHPLLQNNESTLREQHFNTVLKGGEFFLADHKVGDEKVLPAVAYLEMARAAGAYATEVPVTRLSNVTWMQPVKVSGSPVKLSIRINSELEYEVSGDQLHCKGKISTAEIGVPARYDLPSFEQEKTGEECYAIFRSLGLGYGTTFQGIRTLYYHTDAALSKISLPVQAGFALTPGIMDSALQTCMGMSIHDAGLQMMLPFSVREVNLYRSLESDVWCYARRRGKMSYDLDLLNEHGEVLVSFVELVLLPTENTELHVYSNEWQERITTPGSKRASLVVLANAPAILADRLQEVLDCEVMAISACAPDKFFSTVLAEVQKRIKTRTNAHIQVVCTADDLPEYGFISGLLQSAAFESNLITGGVSIVDSLEIDTITTILQGEQPASTIRYHHGKAEEKRLSPLRTTPTTTIRNDGVYLVTGGAGGLGLIFAEYLRHAARVILVGRSATTQATLPANAVYRSCDVADEKAVQQLVSDIKTQYHRLDGIIHSAGVLRDSFVINKTIAEVQDVFSAKVNGARNIDMATKDENLDFIIFCSSLAGHFGNAGQSDYAAANAWLDNYAVYREAQRAQGRRKGRTLSINWPLWRSGGMRIDANTEKYMEQHYGLKPMPTAAGIKALDMLLASEAVQGVVIYGKPMIVPQETATPVVVVADDNAMKLAITYLAKLLSNLLKIPAARLEPSTPFIDFGIDSTIIVNLTNELESIFGKVSRTLFFECQNLHELAEHFVTNHMGRLQELTGSKPAPVIVNKPIAQKQPVNITPVAHDQVAIIGLSGRYPGADNLNIFWENLKAGKDSITEIPSTRWNIHDYYQQDKGVKGKTYSKWGGFINNVDQFDPMFFSISAREAELMDPQERLFLQTVWETIEDAGYTRERLARNVGVYAGVMYEEYQLFGPEETAKGNPTALLGNPSGIANRISYFFNFQGPSMAVDTMCSSSLTAIHLACKDLLSGEIALAIAGGVNVSLHPNKYLILSEGGFASSKGRCESFGEGGEGYVPGEGVGAVLLKPLSKAIADGDRIYGVIKGTAINHGGKTNGYTVPNPKAQAAVIQAAMKKAGVQAADFSYIEAHGTGTSLGDPIEITGLTKAFDTADKQFCSIGSVKSNIGHCESAAGISGLTKVLLQLQHKQLVPSLHSAVLNPNISFADTPFRVQQTLEEWRTNGQPRLAGISGFGAGGSNAHVIIEEYTAPVMRSVADDNPVIIVLSAQHKDRLYKIVSNLHAFVKDNRQVSLHDIAYTLQIGREAMEERLSFVVASVDELLDALQQYLDNDLQYLFTGNTRKDNPGFLLEGKAGKAYIQSAIAEKESSSLAQIWVKGVQLDWDLLYTTHRPARISLPTYPFAEERYWYPKAEVMPTVKIQLHPLLHAIKPESTL